MFKEPELTIVILDYCKPIESRLLLQSIKKYIKFPHKVIFCDNGSRESYGLSFLEESLIDQLIINRESNGLGVGTRDCFNAVTTEYTLYIQNDQVVIREFSQNEFDYIKSFFDQKSIDDRVIKTISLAGSPCGNGIYSERAHLIKTETYKDWEKNENLGFHGAGKFHNGPWREEKIQKIYRDNNYIHWEYRPIIVADNGVFATRDMGVSGVWVHRTDTKQLWCISKPRQKNPSYPKFTDSEWEISLSGNWKDGQIPEIEKKDSFDCWSNTLLGQMQNDYIKDLRYRFFNSKIY